MTLLSMSLQAGGMILGLLLLRRAAMSRLPKKTFSILWIVVLLRLLLPFSLPSPFSVYSWVNEAGVTMAPAEGKVVNVFPIGIVPQDTESSVASVALPISAWTLLWGIGVALCGLYFLIAYGRCRREFRDSCLWENEFAAEWLAGHRLKRPLEIRESARVLAPLTYGVFHPVILMPKRADWQDKEEIQYILTHEYIHIRHFDGAVKILLIAAVCVHWFNPLVWGMLFFANRDMELSCDEEVVHSLGEGVKSAYAMTLIGMEAKKSGFAPFCNRFGKNAMEERIEAIMKIKQQNIFSFVSAFLVIVIMTAVFATSAVASEKETAFIAHNAAGDLYSPYEPLGLTVDGRDGRLYFQGQLVRCFDDQIPGENLSAKAIGYYEEAGTTDVRAIREKGILMRLEVLPKEEFQSRVIPDPAKPLSANGTDIFKEYEAFGLQFDQGERALFYKGERVRQFLDILNSNGFPVDGKEFLGSTISNLDGAGSVDIYATRDYSQIDEKGHGKLTGLRRAAQEEFDENTKALGQTTRIVETAE